MGEVTAPAYLSQTLEVMNERGQQRDSVGGERSMAKAVKAFDTLIIPSILKRGYMLETEGWLFMEVLKMARSTQGVYHEDDYVDLIGYAALAAESASKENACQMLTTQWSPAQTPKTKSPWWGSRLLSWLIS